MRLAASTPRPGLGVPCTHFEVQPRNPVHGAVRLLLNGSDAQLPGRRCQHGPAGLPLISLTDSLTGEFCQILSGSLSRSCIPSQPSAPPRCLSLSFTDAPTCQALCHAWKLQGSQSTREDASNPCRRPAQRGRRARRWDRKACETTRSYRVSTLDKPQWKRTKKEREHVYNCSTVLYRRY